jgi:hypothetical protein
MSPSRFASASVIPGAPVSRMCRAMYSSSRVNTGWTAADCALARADAIELTSTGPPFPPITPDAATTSADFALCDKNLRREKYVDINVSLSLVVGQFEIKIFPQRRKGAKRTQRIVVP